MNARATAACIGAAAAFVVAAFVWTGCGESKSSASESFTLAVAAEDAWTGPTLPAFELIERSGRTVKLADLAGQPWVLAFFFTTCTGPCPAMTNNLRVLQDLLASSRSRLVSISVDPARDTPQVLTQYADAFGADRERWLFLTGEETRIEELATAVSLPMKRAPEGEAVLGMQVAHATRFVVVDGKGVVRGMYDGQTREGLEAAAARVRWLEAHPGR